MSEVIQPESPVAEERAAERREDAAELREEVAELEEAAAPPAVESEAIAEAAAESAEPVPVGAAPAETTPVEAIAEEAAAVEVVEAVEAVETAVEEAVATEPVAEAAPEATPVDAAAQPTEEAASDEASPVFEAASAEADAAQDTGEGESEGESIIDAAELLGESTVAPPSADDERALQRAMVEAAIYITEEPLTLDQIVMAMELPKERIQEILAELVETYAAPTHGVTIREIAGGYKMATKPEHHERIRAFVKKLKPPLKLSLAALETLAVIAYKQPITAPEIMEVRGVQGAGVLKTLIDRKLITPAGRKQVVGKPILYKTTKEFLVQFGLKDLAELPTLKEFEELRRLAFNDDEPQVETQVEAAAPPAATPEAAEAAPAAETETPAQTVEVSEASESQPSADEPQPEAKANEAAVASE